MEWKRGENQCLGGIAAALGTIRSLENHLVGGAGTSTGQVYIPLCFWPELPSRADGWVVTLFNQWDSVLGSGRRGTWALVFTFNKTEATALVHITTPSGNTQIVHVILDSASQSTLINEHCAQMLDVKRNYLKPSNVQGISLTKNNLHDWKTTSRPKSKRRLETSCCAPTSRGSERTARITNPRTNLSRDVCSSPPPTNGALKPGGSCWSNLANPRLVKHGVMFEK
uniref:Uncharacterized protein n=1 Tax=Timema bartmani TaxID=61472 RepID=A0A7R9FB22_9NEOP|nr:unnamed protein product [Timema bartmani]